MIKTYSRHTEIPHKNLMYKDLILQKRLNFEYQPIPRDSEYKFTYSLLPEVPEVYQLIKDPIDPETNDFSCLVNLREEEYKTFEKLASQKSSKWVLIEKSWFSQWKNYLHGGRSPGVIQTSNLVDEFGRVKTGSNSLYIKLTSEQYLFLKDIYSSEPLVEINAGGRANKEKFRNLSFSDTKKDYFPTEDPDENELVTLMDENFCKTTEPKNSETDTITELSLKFYKKKFGFENPAFYCYLNSVLQCFFSIPDTVNHFLSLIQSPDPKSQPWSFQLYSFIYSALKSESKTIRPVALWKEVTKYFSPAQQHDFFEFWRFLVNKLEKENGKNNVFTEIFKGKLKSTLLCRVCQSRSINYEDFYDLSLEFTGSLKKSLQKFCSAEKIKCFCEKCKKKTKHLKTFAVDSGPKVLTIQIKRFQNRDQLAKINDFLLFSKSIKVKTEFGKEKYNLIAMAEHKGSINYGHYNAYCKRYTKWFKFNDAKFYKVPFARVQNKRMYCAVFERHVDHF